MKLNLRDLKPGDQVRTLFGIGCIREGAVRTVGVDDGLYVECTHGRHFLEPGISSEDNGDLIWLERVVA